MESKDLMALENALGNAAVALNRWHEDLMTALQIKGEFPTQLIEDVNAVHDAERELRTCLGAAASEAHTQYANAIYKH